MYNVTYTLYRAVNVVWFWNSSSREGEVTCGIRINVLPELIAPRKVGAREYTAFTLAGN